MFKCMTIESANHCSLDVRIRPISQYDPYGRLISFSPALVSEFLFAFQYILCAGI